MLSILEWLYLESPFGILMCLLFYDIDIIKICSYIGDLLKCCDIVMKL